MGRCQRIREQNVKGCCVGRVALEPKSALMFKGSSSLISLMQDDKGVSSKPLQHCGGLGSLNPEIG